MVFCFELRNEARDWQSFSLKGQKICLALQAFQFWLQLLNSAVVAGKQPESTHNECM